MLILKFIYTHIDNYLKLTLGLMPGQCLRVVPLGGKVNNQRLINGQYISNFEDCDHESEEGVKICNGGVIREKDTTVQICVDGKLKYKKKEEVDPGYPLW